MNQTETSKEATYQDFSRCLLRSCDLAYIHVELFQAPLCTMLVLSNLQRPQTLTPSTLYQVKHDQHMSFTLQHWDEIEKQRKRYSTLLSIGDDDEAIFSKTLHAMERNEFVLFPLSHKDHFILAIWSIHESMTGKQDSVWVTWTADPDYHAWAWANCWTSLN